MDLCIITIQAEVSGTIGGVSTHVKELSNILKKYGHRVVVICPSHPEYPDRDYQEIFDDVLYFCIGKTSLETKTAIWNQASIDIFAKLRQKYDFKLIFSEGIAAQGIIRSSHFGDIPSFCFLHNFGVTHFYNILKEVDSFTSLLYYSCITIPRLIVRILKDEIPTYKACSTVLSCSTHNAMRLRKFYRVRERSILLIPNWINTVEFAPNPESRELGRKHWNLQSNSLVFLLVGSLYLPKGFQVAIKSFGKFLKNNGDAVLLIAGNGRHKNDLKYLASKLGLIDGHHIRFLGEVHRSKLPLLYNAADIFLMPSLFLEVLPYTLLEAMSCGLPFIGSRLGGVREAAGDVGILIRPGDHRAMAEAMADLARNHEKRKNLGSLGRKRVEKLFSQKATFPVIHQLMQRLT